MQSILQLRIIYVRVFLLILTAFSTTARADRPWFFEAEFAYMLPNSDRLLLPTCTKVIPQTYVAFYSTEQRPGWEVSCGNRQPLYTHFIGRRCGQPLPRLVIECGWRHLSSPFDSEEVSFDALAVRGRFTWGQ